MHSTIIITYVHTYISYFQWQKTLSTLYQYCGFKPYRVVGIIHHRTFQLNFGDSYDVGVIDYDSHVKNDKIVFCIVDVREKNWWRGWFADVPPSVGQISASSASRSVNPLPNQFWWCRRFVAVPPSVTSALCLGTPVPRQTVL